MVRETIRKADNLFTEIMIRLAFWREWRTGVHKITLSEVMMFWLCLMLALWLIVFDPSEHTATYSHIQNEGVWAAWGIITAACHFISLLLKKIWLRQVAGYGYIFFWFGLCVITVWGNHESLAVPAYAVLAVTAMFITARQTRGNVNDIF